jgi:hypothetical protein
MNSKFVNVQFRSAVFVVVMVVVAPLVPFQAGAQVEWQVPSVFWFVGGTKPETFAKRNSWAQLPTLRPITILATHQ